MIVAEPDTEATPDEPAAAGLAPERVAELKDAGKAELVDVREPDEWRQGHVAGARHIALEDVSGRAAEIGRDRTAIFYCASGNRSAMVADAFRCDGYDAHSMAGGISAWKQAGLPLETGEPGGG